MEPPQGPSWLARVTEVSCDRLACFDLELKQPRTGYRYSLDALILARFAPLCPAGRILELGAGCGVISLVLARRNPESVVVAIESNPVMADISADNARTNQLDGRVTVLHADVLDLKKMFPDSGFDLVVSNPPYRTPGTGRLSPHAGRDTARHESTAGLADFLAAAKYQVKPGGRICFIHHPSRFVEFVTQVSAQKLSLLQLQMVHGTVGGPATMFLAEVAKGRRATPRIAPPLFVRNQDGDYTGDVWR